MIVVVFLRLALIFYLLFSPYLFGGIALIFEGISAFHHLICNAQDAQHVHFQELLNFRAHISDFSKLRYKSGCHFPH